MQVNATSESVMARHQGTAICFKGHKRKLQRKVYRGSALSLDKKFTEYEQKLKRVEFFKYLGRLLTYDANNIQDVCNNLADARTFWARISDVLQVKNMCPKVCRMIYKATIQTVLLYRSKSWNLTKVMMRRLEGFHITAAYQMARTYKLQENDGGSWTYPSSKDVFEGVGIYPIDHYIRVRRNSIINFVAIRLVYKICKNAERRPGTSHHCKWWRDQEMSLDKEDTGVYRG